MLAFGERVAAYYRTRGLDTTIRRHVRLSEECQRPSFYRDSAADFNVLLVQGREDVLLDSVQLVRKKKCTAFTREDSALQMWLGWPQSRTKNVGRAYSLTRPQMDLLLSHYTGKTELLARLDQAKECSTELYQEAVEAHTCLMNLWDEDSCLESSKGHTLPLDHANRAPQYILDHLQFVLVEALSQAVADMDMDRPRLSLLDKPPMPVDKEKTWFKEVQSCDSVFDSFCQRWQKDWRTSQSGDMYRLF